MKQKTADIIFRITQAVVGAGLIINATRAVRAYMLGLKWAGQLSFTALMTASAFALVHIPRFIRRRDLMIMPPILQSSFVLFSASAMFLGKVVGFYGIFPWWDLMLHFSAGIMFAFIGYAMYVTMNKNPQTREAVNPIFIAVFASCFSVASSAAWEVFEFAMDCATNMNMQGWVNDYSAEMWAELQNVSNASNPGLIDTMTDLVAGCAGALLSIPAVKRLAKRGDDLQ